MSGASEWWARPQRELPAEQTAASSPVADSRIASSDTPALRRPLAVPTYESNHVSWLATARQTMQQDSRACAHRYLADGRIELICLTCLKPICVVRGSQDADVGRARHLCVNPLPSRCQEPMTGLPKLRQAWLSFLRGDSPRGIFARLLRES